MTFEEWWNQNAYNALYVPPHQLPVRKGQAHIIWRAATRAERERWEPLINAARELLDNVKLRYLLESDEELECEYMRALAAALTDTAEGSGS